MISLIAGCWVTSMSMGCSYWLGGDEDEEVIYHNHDGQGYETKKHKGRKAKMKLYPVANRCK
jgi:hypothetical protein